MNLDRNSVFTAALSAAEFAKVSAFAEFYNNVIYSETKSNSQYSSNLPIDFLNLLEISFVNNLPPLWVF